MEGKRSEIQNRIMDIKSLPTLPGIIAKLQTLSENDKASVHHMAELVGSDQVLSARVLKLVNSPSYGFYRVATISNAIILLGVNVVKSLAISTSIFEIMEEHIVGLWEHSMGVGVAANIIARRLKLQEVEEIATAALMHDIGKVIVKLKFGEDYDQLLQLMKKEDLSMTQAEIQLLGVSHAEVGAWLAKSWFLPDKLVEPVACHHDVEASLQHPVKTAVVHLADVLVKGSGFAWSGDDMVPAIQRVAWQRLDLNDYLLAEIVNELEDRLVEVKNFSMEIQSANEQSDTP